MTVQRFLWWALRAFYALLWVGGVVSYALWGGPPEGTGWAAPTFLFAAALLVLWGKAPERGHRGARGAAALAGVGVAGWGIEALGVSTGWPFGGYDYTDHLAPRLLGVPLALAAAWVVVAGHGRAMARLFAPAGGVGLRATLAALWMTAFDLLLDPLAAGPLGYWRWGVPDGWYGVPWTNFAGWLVVSFGLVAGLEWMDRTPSSGADDPAARWVGLSVVVFFLVLAWVEGLWVPGLVGAGLAGVQLAIGDDRE